MQTTSAKFRLYSYGNMMDKTNATLTALRQILRATNLHGNKVAMSVGLTAVQLQLLKFVQDTERATSGKLASQLHVSQATMTVLLDKLAAKNMIQRRPSDTDRRQKLIIITQAGRDALIHAPDPMQRSFSRRFEALEEWEQSMLLTAVERIAFLLQAEKLDASPILATGEITSKVGCSE